MKPQDEFRKNLAAQEVEAIIRSVLEEYCRPADQQILTGKEVIKLLGISPRTLATWRQQKIITYTRITGVITYRFSDVLQLLDRYKVRAIETQFKIARKKAADPLRKQNKRKSK